MAGLTQLGRHLRCYADDGETWKPLHDQVMVNHDVDDALAAEVSYGLPLYHRVKTKTTRTFEDAKTLYLTYIAWHDRSLQLVAEIEASEEQDFHVEGAAQFKAAFTDIQSRITTIKG